MSDPNPERRYYDAADPFIPAGTPDERIILYSPDCPASVRDFLTSIVNRIRPPRLTTEELIRAAVEVQTLEVERDGVLDDAMEAIHDGFPAEVGRKLEAMHVARRRLEAEAEVYARQAAHYQGLKTARQKAAELLKALCRDLVREVGQADEHEGERIRRLASPMGTFTAFRYRQDRVEWPDGEPCRLLAPEISEDQTTLRLTVDKSALPLGPSYTRLTVTASPRTDALRVAMEAGTEVPGARLVPDIRLRAPDAQAKREES